MCIMSLTCDIRPSSSSIHHVGRGAGMIQCLCLIGRPEVSGISGGGGNSIARIVVIGA